MYNYSDLRVVNGSFARCTNIGFNYFFPPKTIASLGLNNLSLSFNVSNPFIIKSKEFKGLDPEVASGNQPVTRAYAFTVNISL